MEGTPFALQQVGGEAAMADYSRRPQYDEPLSEEDEAVADSGTELAYRRLAASSGEQQRSRVFPDMSRSGTAVMTTLPRCSRPVRRVSTLAGKTPAPRWVQDYIV